MSFGARLTGIIPLRAVTDLDHHAALYFFGAARQGQALLDALGDLTTWSFRGFIDSHQSGDCRGYPILSPEQFRTLYRVGDQVVIASAYVFEIAAILSELGVAQAFDANAWFHIKEADEEVAVVSAQSPLQRGSPVAGSEMGPLIEAQQRCDQSDFEGAAAILIRAQNDHRNSAMLLSMLSYVRFAQNRNEEALDLCRRALAIEPGRVPVLDRMGCIYFTQRRYQEVIEVANELLRRDPDYSPAVLNHASALLRTGVLGDHSERLRDLLPDVSAGNVALIERLRAVISYLQEALAEVTIPIFPKRDRKRFVLALTVFRAEYLTDFFAIAMPSLLGRGNLDFWSEKTDSVFLIFTNESEAQRIRSEPVFVEAEKYVKCEIHSFPDELVLHDRGFRYHVLNATHAVALAIAKSNGAGIMFLAPDVVFSEDFMRCLWDEVVDGKEVLFCNIFGVDRRRFHQLFARGSSLNAENLTRFALDVGLPARDEEYQDGGVMSRWPVRLFWRLPDGGMLSRSYVAHPILLTSEALESYSGEHFFSNDSDFLKYIEKRDPDFERCLLLPDVKRAVAFELVDAALGAAVKRSVPPLFTDVGISQYGFAFGPVHRWLFEQTAKCTILPDEVIASEIAEAERAVQRITEGTGRLDAAYGRRQYAAGYSPYLSGGFPQFPVEV